MKKIISLLTLIALFLLFAAPISPVFAEIRNPAVNSYLGQDAQLAGSGATFVMYFITLWRALITVGALAVIIYMLWGALEWIYAGGDSGKISKARDKMTQAIIGLILLVGSFVIIGFISMLFFGNSFNILKLDLPTPNDQVTNPAFDQANDMIDNANDLFN